VSVADEQLVARALGGSQAAYREIVRRYERPVFNLVARIVRDREVAEDLSQDAFVKAFTRLETYRPEQGKFSNWLFKIAHNTSLDHLRRGTLDTVPLEPREDDEGAGLHGVVADTRQTSPLEAAVAGDLAEAVDEALDRLRPEYREVIVLRAQEDRSYEEIADITGLPLGTVKTYIHRARKELAATLGRAGWDPAGHAPGAETPHGGRA
jgi:RNA polymerase sigma-70 factor (ECF subfamily)